jgi:hypothetical protein
MSTRGFVGYKKNGVTRGWYNHLDSYPSELGMKVLNKYEELTKEELTDFFENDIVLLPDEEKNQNFYRNHKVVFNYSWRNPDFVFTLLETEADFMNANNCDYSYVFDLDNDTVIVNQAYIVTRDNIEEFMSSFKQDELPENKPLTEDPLTTQETTVAFLINALATIRDRNKENNILIDEVIEGVLERGNRK